MNRKLLSLLGNGNAALFRDNDSVFTFSVHCGANLFSDSQTSDLDVELESGCEDREYLETLLLYLPELLHRVRPDLVFFQAGVDPHEEDRLGRLALSRAGLRERNRLVYNTVRAHGVKLVVTMGGGYPKSSDEASAAFDAIMQAHADVYRDMAEVYYGRP